MCIFIRIKSAGFVLVEKHFVAMHSPSVPFNMKDLISSISTSSVYRHHIERDISISAYYTNTLYFSGQAL